MIKLQLTKAERDYLEWNRGLTTDTYGNEVFCGLTAPESAELLDLRSQPKPIDSKKRDRRVFLNNKHEMARIAVVNAEIEARESGPKN
jgi:hypothetical protein